ncbi:hypothetical protein EMIT048CA2_100154 [Pseudomonas chlororaphis]
MVPRLAIFCFAPPYPFGSDKSGITLALALPCDCENPISDGLLAWRRAKQQRKTPPGKANSSLSS